MSDRIGRNTLLRAAAAALVGLAAMLGVAAPASADVIVPPGRSGNICSGYLLHQASGVRFQTCAWADDNEVYFTVNFKNPTASAKRMAGIYLGFYHAGSFNAWCLQDYGWQDNEMIVVPAGGVKGTPTAECAYPRTRGAYQATAWVGNTGPVTSDSLQVQ
ncbi:hypothetical protein GCM10009557_79080 [Virgisporangium ochraceum]|uniref:Secreted protein n=1 Tax=Virgisporangium ochraceum TaxID=65505 RepID=A0A8J3ZZ85_9ACTN|nr:hypothetical protein [Virgisporangium ochraceum]GIJ71602.1 hypothetical protein Voc01_065190 [Virgisporangium ochraceum]